MNNRKFRWSKVYESSEEELIDFFASRKLDAQRIAGDALLEQLQPASEHDCTVWCAEGSLVVRQGSMVAKLQPGDALHIAADTAYEFLAGISGFVCYRTQQTAR